MNCPNCGRANDDTSTYCSGCASLLNKAGQSRAETLKAVEIAGNLFSWLAGIMLAILLVLVVLAAATSAIVAAYDLISGHRLMVGLGGVFAFVGGVIALVSVLGLFNISEKTAISRRGTVPTVVFYRTMVQPVMSAMRSTPRTYYDNSLVIAAAGFLLFLLGLLSP